MQPAEPLDLGEQHVVLRHRLHQRGLEHPGHHRGQGQSEGEARKQHMREQQADCAEIAANHALDKVELGGEFDRQRRVEPARDRQHRDQDAEEEDQQQGPEEVGDRHREPVHRVDRGLGPAPAPIDRGEGQRDAERDAEQDGEPGELQRRRQPAEDQRRHILLEGDRGAEIALHRAAEIEDELVEDRLVEAVEGAQPLDVRHRRFGADHHRHRISRHHPEQHEHDDGDAEQRRHRHPQPRQEIPCRHSGRPRRSPPARGPEVSPASSGRAGRSSQYAA